MNTNFRKLKEKGSAILVTLGLTAVIGTALASYLKLVQFQNRAVVRSQTWNGAMPLCEAGIEEALAHLNYVGDGDRAANGWVKVGDEYYMNRYIGESRYEVWMNSSNQPTVTTKGYTLDGVTQQTVTRKVLVDTTRFGAGMRGILTKQAITMNGNCKIDSFDSEDPNYSTYGRYDSTKAKDNGYAGSIYSYIDTGGAGIWGWAATGPNGYASANVGDASWMASHTGIQSGHYRNDLNVTLYDVSAPFNGGGLTPNQNLTLTITNYLYLSNQVTFLTCPNPIPPGGVITNVQTITTTNKPFSWSGIMVTNTAPQSTTNYPAAGTYVGNVVTRTVILSGGQGKKSVTVTWYDYTAITGYTCTTTTYTINSITTNTSTRTDLYTHVTDTGNYQLNGLTLSGQQKLMARGDTVLYITGEFSMTGQSEILVMPGASLKIFVTGNVNLSGNGIMNFSCDATKFAIMGLPTCTSLSLDGNASFTGAIYAPQANISLNGGGNNTYDCVGAVVGNSADFHGHFNFHYDERLGRIPVKIQFKVAYWSEI